MFIESPRKSIFSVSILTVGGKIGEKSGRIGRLKNHWDQCIYSQELLSKLTVALYFVLDRKL